MTLITEQQLIEAGFKPKTFFYEIGGGEDEDDMTIYIKDDIALMFDFQRKVWLKRPYSSLSYINGFNSYLADVVEHMEEL